MRAKQKIPANAHECVIYKTGSNFLMEKSRSILSSVWILADAFNYFVYIPGIHRIDLPGARSQLDNLFLILNSLYGE